MIVPLKDNNDDDDNTSTDHAHWNEFITLVVICHIETGIEAESKQLHGDDGKSTFTWAWIGLSIIMVCI
jgi:hypothetical protein